jgi:DNA invertase Pin-like site-specific DNA recombinase
MKLIEIFRDEGVSGTFMFQRLGFGALMKVIDKGDTLVANDLSRVSRNIRDTAELIEKFRALEIKAVFIKDSFDTSTMMGEAMAQMASIMKQMEARQTAERTKDTLQDMKMRGKNISRPPYGWKKEKKEKGSKLIEDPKQQKIITFMRILHVEKKMGYEEIARELNGRGAPSPGKGEKGWSGKAVKKVIDRTEVCTKGRGDK